MIGSARPSAPGKSRRRFCRCKEERLRIQRERRKGGSARTKGRIRTGATGDASLLESGGRSSARDRPSGGDNPRASGARGSHPGAAPQPLPPRPSLGSSLGSVGARHAGRCPRARWPRLQVSRAGDKVSWTAGHATKGGGSSTRHPRDGGPPARGSGPPGLSTKRSDRTPAATARIA